MAYLVVGVEDLFVVEVGHFLVVVVLHKGYDLAWALLAVLQGEADRLHLAPVVVAGVGNFHIVFAQEDVVDFDARLDTVRLPRVAWDVLRKDRVAVDHPVLVEIAVDQAQPL